ncbi:hypothetical protein C0992_008316 [Termitomyces sp. T32_za158]|nr:hypothetical protein C0992_008316 [Termitomyces sp. T32_za158]
MHIQDMKSVILDFYAQMGINEKTLKNRCFVASGDGKTFDQLIKLRKMMVAEEGDFDSFYWLIPLLELWHTKWTDLSQTICSHWGEEHTNDPSTLACIAKIAACPTPKDLQKVEFFDGVHLVNLALDANILNCWEFHFETSDLQELFTIQKEMDALPTFKELFIDAGVLAHCHATTKAFRAAHKPNENNPDKVPRGSPWIDRQTGENKMDFDDPMEGLPDIFIETNLQSPDADITLANATLFMRNAIWWREMCHAIIKGDSQRQKAFMRIIIAPESNHPA